MQPRPKATCHHGTCHQCHGEGEVLTIAGGSFDLSLCGACLALLVGDGVVCNLSGAKGGSS
jgi:hypothetical protein